MERISFLGGIEHMAWEELKETLQNRGSMFPRRSGIEPPGDCGARWKRPNQCRIRSYAFIGTERHDARRIDLQLRGRSGRQGDPGCSRFFISLEDDLMRIFAAFYVHQSVAGMKNGEAIESPMVTKRDRGPETPRILLRQRKDCSNTTR
ncbi:MAG: hypothetical protein R3C12_19855 [Planctomycetaceae bacterium]